jgi:hypothetical protein
LFSLRRLPDRPKPLGQHSRLLRYQMALDRSRGRRRRPPLALRKESTSFFFLFTEFSSCATISARQTGCLSDMNCLRDLRPKAHTRLGPCKNQLVDPAVRPAPGDRVAAGHRTDHGTSLFVQSVRATRGDSRAGWS